MKTVFPTRQVAHVYANESQDAGRNGQGNLYFSGGVIFSYRDSWPLCVLTPFTDADGARVAIVNACSYSVTTSRHLRHVRDALRGLPFRIIDIPSQVTGQDARDLDNGRADALPTLAKSCAAESRGNWSEALRKRCEYRARHLLASALENHANALALVALIPDAATRRKARQEVGALPAEFPRDLSSDDLIAELSVARKAQQAREAIATMRKAISNARGYWKAARDPANDATIRRVRAKSCVSELRSAAIFARRCGEKLPRGLPTIKAVEAYRDKLEPLEMVQRFNRNSERVIMARDNALSNYYSAMRGIRTGYSLAPGALRLQLGNPNNARSIVKICQEVRKVTDAAHPDAFKPDASAHPVKMVRAAYLALRAECVATLAALEPLEARTLRMATREAMQAAQDVANRDITTQSDDANALAWVMKRLQEAQEARDASPELARGLRITYTPEQARDIAKRYAKAAYFARVEALACATSRARECAAQALDSNASRAYSAVRDADSARLALQNARDILQHCERMRADAEMAQGLRESELVAALPGVAESVASATAHAAGLECDAVAAWRAHDRFAPVPERDLFPHHGQRPGNRVKPWRASVSRSGCALVATDSRGCRAWRVAIVAAWRRAVRWAVPRAVDQRGRFRNRWLS